MIKQIFFDLDGTLYDNYEYFKSAFITIAKYLSDKVSKSCKDIELNLWKVLNEKTTMHPRLFNDLLEHYGIEDKSLVKKAVELLYASSLSHLKLYPDAEEVIGRLKRKYNLGIITKGSKNKQIRTIRQLKLDEIIPQIIYAQDLNYAKNDPRLYEHALRISNKRAEECAYIGDNPCLDFEAPNKLNILTFRLMRGEFKNVELEGIDAKIKINNFFELEDKLL